MKKETYWQTRYDNLSQKLGERIIEEKAKYWMGDRSKEAKARTRFLCLRNSLKMIWILIILSLFNYGKQN